MTLILSALRISLKGAFQTKVLVTPTWNFAELGEYLCTLVGAEAPPLICRNHQLHEAEPLHPYLGQTFDCHFVEKKLLLRLKIEKPISIHENEILPLNLSQET